MVAVNGVNMSLKGNVVYVSFCKKPRTLFNSVPTFVSSVIFCFIV